MPLPDAHALAPPAPRHALAWAALVYALGTLLLAYPALGGGFLVSPVSDQYIAGYPFREFAAEWLRAGRGFPLWNPYQFGGMPYVAAMHGDIFYPTFLLRMVLETDVAMTWSFILHLFFAGLFTFVFLRATGLGFFPSLLGGMAYMLAGQIASYAAPGHDGKLYVSALLPLFLWALQRAVRDGRRWGWGAIALIIGFAVLSPHPQLLQYMLLAGGAFTLYLAFGRGDAIAEQGRLDRRTGLLRLGAALGAIALGMLIGGIQYVPVVTEYVGWSPRAGGTSWDHSVSYSFPPEELINTYLPQFSGILDAYWGRNAIHFHSEYLGAAVLLLATAAFGGGALVRRGFLWFWTGTLVVSLLWALGGFTPFYQLVYALVPGTRYFRAPSTIFFVTTFAVAVLAAIGTQRVLARQVGKGLLIGWLVVAGVVLLLGTSGGLTNVGLALAGAQRADWVIENRGAVVIGAVRSFAFVLLAAVVILAARTRRFAPHAAGWALVVVVTVDLWSVARHYWVFSPPAEVIYASDPAIDHVRSQPQPGRVLALALGPPQVRNDPFLRGAGLMVHDVRTALGYHGNQIGRYDALWGADEGGAQLANPNFWQLANVRFLLTDVADPPIEGVERVAGPVRNAAGSMVYLFRMPGDNPMTWVTPVIVQAPDPAVLATIREPAFDVRSAALFDTAAAVTGVQVQRPPPPLDIASEVTAYEPGAIAVRLSEPAPAGSALMVSENYYPGWRAFAGTRELVVGRAGYSLIGVALEEGVTDVRLSFESSTYERGKLLTISALILTIVLLAWGLFAERLRRA